MILQQNPRVVTATGGHYGRYSSSNNNQSYKPLPPYGKEAAFLLSWGVQPRNNIFIFAGFNAWQKARAFENTQVVLCLPLEVNPFIYFWPVNNCSILLVDTGGLSITDIEIISYCLLCADATIVHALLANGTLVIYRRASA